MTKPTELETAWIEYNQSVKEADETLNKFRRLEKVSFEKWQKILTLEALLSSGE